MDLIVRYPAPFETRREVEQRVLKRYHAFMTEHRKMQADAAKPADAKPNT